MGAIMPTNDRIACIALKIAFRGLPSLHEAVMGFYNGAIEGFNALKRGDKRALRNAIAQMDKHAGISGKMLSICNAFETAQKAGATRQIIAYFEQAFGALLPDMQRTYDFYGKACAPFKAEFEKLAKKARAQIGAL